VENPLADSLVSSTTGNNNTTAVFFDLDGTLIDTAPDMGGALNRVIQRHGREPVPASRYRAQVSHGSIALLKLGFPELDPATEMQELREEFLSTYEENIADDSILFDGVEPLLQQLEAWRMPWGIITNKPEALTLKLLDAMDITPRCCSIVAADTTTHAKPHPAPMLLACKRANVDAARCVYVGDARRDIDAGRAVAMKTCVASWGYISPADDKPDQWQADVMLSAPMDLLAHID
jgi:phosphoglycolate phosphatase